jgi:hypothetical protein
VFAVCACWFRTHSQERAILDESQPESDEKPGDKVRRWATELEAAKKKGEKFVKNGERVVKRFLDERESKTSDSTRWNLFTANVITQQAMLYDRPPRASVSRRFADSLDDVARVAGEILERQLNTDIEEDGESFELAIYNALEDRLLPGLGVARVRYEPRFATVAAVAARVDESGVEVAPEVPASEVKEGEEVEVDYVHWQDFLWSPSRTWDEVRWVAFRALMSRRQAVKRFGDVGQQIPLNAKKERDESKSETPWGRAEVWEIWDKETETVLWYCPGFATMLDEKADPLQLDGFFPCARPMMANTTTSSLMPRADYVLCQDLYEEVDSVSTRITMLERAIRVTGVYDKANGEIAKVVDGGDNKLYPVDNWAMFAERGGVKGAVDWLPLDQVVAALTALRDYRRELMDALREISGMSDIMRGQAADTGATATEQRIKARASGVRMRRMQNEFVRFATDIQKLKAQIILKHFDAATILERSNCERTADAPYAQKAVELLKSGASKFRIEVKAESVALADFDALKSERMEVLQGLATFFQAAAPVAQQMPGSLPFMLEMLQWTVSGFRGASEMEGILDRAIAGAQQQAAAPQQPAPPDEKLLALQLKGQNDLAKTQADLQADLQRTQAETQANAQREQDQARWNTQEAAAKAQISAASRAQFGGLP